MSELIKQHFEEFVLGTTKNLNDRVFALIHSALQARPEIRKNLNPAFPFPRELRIGLLKNCLAIEYVGPEKPEEHQFETNGIFLPSQDVFDFLGLNLGHLKTGFTPPPFANVTNTAFFIGDSIRYLTDYFYDFPQMPIEMFMLNGYTDFREPKDPLFISNTTFFWTDPEGALKIRHIDLLELVPLLDGNVVYHSDESYEAFAHAILATIVPTYETKLHGVLNQFIELVNLPETRETDITSFVEEHPDILLLAFGAQRVHSQVELTWQYAAGKPNLKPDFMLKRMDGFSDILDFKLPNLKGNPLVGTAVRRQPSHEVDSAIAQVIEYRDWCGQEINSRWLEKEKGIKVLRPVTYLIMGHSKDFAPEDRRKLRDTRNTVVFTYDELIEMARFQLYRAH